MSKQAPAGNKSKGAPQAPAPQEPTVVGVDPAAGDDFTVTTVAGASFIDLDPSEILTHKEYPDRVVVVTIDGRKLTAPKEASE